MWHMPDWRGSLLTKDCKPENGLHEYAKTYDSVEGNTTFYGVPDVIGARKWFDAVDGDFRFIFKVPKSISHGSSLASPGSIQEWQRFLQFCDALEFKLGQVFLQLPPDFAGTELNALEAFIVQLPKNLMLCVEVRHLDFFLKGDFELRLNRLLSKYQANRVMFDSRGLFLDVASNYGELEKAAIIDAQSKKPRFPLHVIDTGPSPVIRFLGHQRVAKNEAYWGQWSEKLKSWQSSGLKPYFFMHTAGNHQVPEVAKLFSDKAGVFEGKEGFLGKAEAKLQPQLF